MQVSVPNGRRPDCWHAMAFEKMLQPHCVVAKIPMNRLLSCLGDRYLYLLDAGTTGPLRFLCDCLQCQVELLAAVALKAAQHITRQTFAVEPDQNCLFQGKCTFHQRQVFAGFGATVIRYERKLTVPCCQRASAIRQTSFGQVHDARLS